MLSLGALKEVYEGRQDEETVVQVLGVRQLPGDEEKWRINITAMNHLMWEKELTKHAIIKTKIICQVVGAKRVLILQDVKIINHGWRVNGIYGSPKNIDYQEIENICARCTKLHKCSE